MATKKLSDLPAAAAILGTETVFGLQSGVSVQIPYGSFKDITATGDVGIGYATPANTLHVAGGNTQIRVSTPTNNFYFDMGRDSVDGLFQINGNQGSGYKWLNNGTEAMRINSSGNVGIGTVSPVTSLTVQAGSGNGIKVYDASTGSSTWPCIESIGSRGDANATFGGRFGAGYRRNDGTAITTGVGLGTYSFGGQWGTGTTYNQTNFLYSASITGESEGSFTSATAMPTALVFRTGSTGASLQGINVVYGTERMRIDAAGNVTLQENISVGGAAPTTSGTGITFPATQAASTDANTLDDYEEGTWTPVLTSGFTTTGTVTRSGTYTKIGRVVTVGWIVQATTVSPANAAVMSGLPFAGVYGIGQSTNVGGTITPMSISTGAGGSVLTFGGVSISTPNLVGNITYTV
jgi:hypothetical protein